MGFLQGRILLVCGLVVIAVASRLVPHPPNLTSIGALALFGGACFSSRRAAFLAPLAGMFLSDLVLGHYLAPTVYASFALTVCLGMRLRARRTAVPIAGAAFSASVLFFAVTNFGVWAFGSLYPRTWEGLVACYVAAIPFFQNTLIGNLLYAALLFGALEVFERSFPALREPAVQS